ncbi:MAG: hypothetical protein NTY38_09085, partial [Acidobacteria bacterium]|nr:hypothetical protein [Acidobacteriota bacterium]
MAEHRQEWWKGNVDVYCHDLFVCLRDEVLGGAAGGGSLGWASVYRFFSSLQTSLGATPHFRLEIILARIAQEQLLDALATADREGAGVLFKIALRHADRARVINPRLSECTDLQKQLRETFQERRVISDAVAPAV